MDEYDTNSTKPSRRIGRMKVKWLMVLYNSYYVDGCLSGKVSHKIIYNRCFFITDKSHRM